MRLKRPSLLPWLLKSLPRQAASVQTAFGEADVLECEDADDLPIRVLAVDGAWESASYLDDGWCELVFPYHRLYNRLFAIRPMATHFLMLGGGGFSWPKWLLAHTHDTDVDVVEIDPAIVALAREWFGLDRAIAECDPEGSRLRIHEEDARAFLDGAAGRGASYDVILNDVYAASDAPRQVRTLEAARSASQALAPDGLFLLNVISALEGPESQPLADAEAALRPSFPSIAVLPCSPDKPRQRDNVVVIASKREEPLDLEGASALGLAERMGRGRAPRDADAEG